MKAGNALKQKHLITENNQIIAKLHENNHYLESIFRVAPTGIGLVKDRIIIDVNEFICQMTGYSHKELIGRSARFLYPNEETYQYVGEEKYRQIRERDTGTVETQWQCKGGHIIDVLLSSTPLDIDDYSKGVTFTVLDITEQKRTNTQLKIFRKQIDQSKDAVFVIDFNTSKFLDVNLGACYMLGYSRQELLNKSVIEISSFCLDVMDWKAVSDSVKNKKKGITIEDEYLCKDGSILPVEVSAIYQLNDNKKNFVASVRDISERKLKEQELIDKNKFIQTVIDGISDSVMVINADYSVPMMNKSAQSLINHKYINDINNPKCYEISHNHSSPCTGVDHQCPLKQVLKNKKICRVVHQHIDGADKVKQVELTATPLMDEHGDINAIIESAHDITDLVQTQQDLQQRSFELDHLAHHDELTELPNRLLFSDRLLQSVKSAHRHKKKVALLFIDLDNFKKINDSLGHAVGDIVLIETAKRLHCCVRETDTIARLGGDEFTIIIEEIEDNDIVTEIVTKIIQNLQEVFIVDGHKLYVTCSVGISIYPNDAKSPENLLRNADSAMYKAKDKGRNTYSYYTENMTQEAFEHILMESMLRHALKNNEIIVYYQPQVNSQNNQIVGMEALVRWQNPKLGVITPNQFIPLAEKTGLIIELGEQVFDMATKQMAVWMKDFSLQGRMSINLSGKQFQQTQLLSSLSTILKKNKCKPKWIELEITENHVMDDPEQAIETLQNFQDTGIEIAIDDFGTGYSSLSYLKRLPINKLKIDQSFVRDIETDEDDRLIVNSIISLAKNMKLNVIAEGVETIKQKKFLLEQECEFIQGYYYSPPISSDDMTKLLQSTDWIDL